MLLEVPVVAHVLHHEGVRLASEGLEARGLLHLDENLERVQLLLHMGHCIGKEL